MSIRFNTITNSVNTFTTIRAPGPADRQGRGLIRDSLFNSIRVFCLLCPKCASMTPPETGFI